MVKVNDKIQSLGYVASIDLHKCKFARDAH